MTIASTSAIIAPRCSSCEGTQLFEAQGRGEAFLARAAVKAKKFWLTEIRDL